LGSHDHIGNPGRSEAEAGEEVILDLIHKKGEAMIELRTVYAKCPVCHAFKLESGQYVNLNSVPDSKDRSDLLAFDQQYPDHFTQLTCSGCVDQRLNQEHAIKMAPALA